MNKTVRLQQLARDIVHCPSCKQDSLGNSVPGEGAPDACLVFVGEAPGKKEAESGRPFVGKSGKFLHEEMHAIGLTEERVFITSVCKYLPLRGRPTEKQIAHGKTHLAEQIAVINPQMIVLLGSVACRAIFGEAISVAKDHGKSIRANGHSYFISFHPAAAIRFVKIREYFKADFMRLKALIATL